MQPTFVLTDTQQMQQRNRQRMQPDAVCNLRWMSWIFLRFSKWRSIDVPHDRVMIEWDCGTTKVTSFKKVLRSEHVNSLRCVLQYRVIKNLNGHYLFYELFRKKRCPTHFGNSCFEEHRNNNTNMILLNIWIDLLVKFPDHYEHCKKSEFISKNYKITSHNTRRFW